MDIIVKEFEIEKENSDEKNDEFKKNKDKSMIKEDESFIIDEEISYLFISK